jgi:hypothetical protein
MSSPFTQQTSENNKDIHEHPASRNDKIISAMNLLRDQICANQNFEHYSQLKTQLQPATSLSQSISLLHEHLIILNAESQDSTKVTKYNNLSESLSVSMIFNSAHHDPSKM